MNGKRVSDFLFTWVITTGLVGIILYSVAHSVSLPVSVPILLLVFLYITIISLICFIWPGRLLVVLCCWLISVVLIFGIVFYLQTGTADAIPETASKVLVRVFISAQEFLKGYLTPLEPDAGLVIAVVVGSLFTSISAYFLFSRRDLLWPIIFGATVLVFEWLAFYDRAVFHLKVFLLFGVTAHILHTDRITKFALQALKKKTINRLGASLLLTALVISFIMVLFADLLPNTFAAASLGGLDEHLIRYVPGLRNLRGSTGLGGLKGGGLAREYSLKQSGYAEDERYLGGPMVENRLPAFNLKVSGLALPEYLYLRGNSKEIYTGRGWTSIQRIYHSLKDNEYLKSHYASDVRTIRLRMTITPLTLTSPTVFTTLQAERIITPEGTSYVDLNHNARVYQPMDSDVSYRVTAQIPITDPQTLSRAAQLNSTTPGIYPDYAQRHYLEYTYLQLPSSLPLRVKELAKEIVGDISDPYQKAVALEQYLKETYQYKLDVPRPNLDLDGFDFVDYFLFDSKEGYCTYFATAMTVLLRTQGIPARFVIGFVVLLEDGKAEYTVENSNAHAWVEAFIPNYGWVTFDPTPGSNTPTRYMPDPLVGIGDRGDDTSGQPGEIGGGRPVPLPDEEPDMPKRGQDGLSGVFNRVGGYAPAAILIIVGVIIIWIVFRLLSLWLEENRFPERANERVRCYYKKLRDLLTPFGLGPQPSATPYEYMDWLSDKLDADKSLLVEFARCYERARYGGVSDDDVERDWFKAILPQFKQRLRTEHGLFNYYKIRVFPFFGPPR